MMDEVQELENQLRHVIDSAIEVRDIRVLDLLGMLESIKYDLLVQSRKDNE